MLNFKKKLLFYIFLMFCLYYADSGVRQQNNFKQVVFWKADSNHQGKEIIFDKIDTLGKDRADLYLEGKKIVNVDYNCLTLLY